jgi:hypothetical protein
MSESGISALPSSAEAVQHAALAYARLAIETGGVGRERAADALEAAAAEVRDR